MRILGCITVEEGIERNFFLGVADQVKYTHRTQFYYQFDKMRKLRVGLSRRHIKKVRISQAIDSVR